MFPPARTAGISSTTAKQHKKLLDLFKIRKIREYGAQNTMLAICGPTHAIKPWVWLPTNYDYDWMIQSRNRVRAGRIFFLTLCPKKISVYKSYSAPTLVFSKFRGVVPWKNIQRHWGCNQRKVWSFSERSLLETCKGINRTLATGTLSRDVCPHGPKIDSGYFLCNMYAWGLCPFLGTEIYSEKSLAPRNLSGINLGTTPRRHHTQG